MTESGGWTNEDTYSVAHAVNNTESIYTWLHEQIDAAAPVAVVAEQLARRIRGDREAAQVPSWVNLDNVNWNEIAHAHCAA